MGDPPCCINLGGNGLGIQTSFCLLFRSISLFWRHRQQSQTWGNCTGQNCPPFTLRLECRSSSRSQFGSILYGTPPLMMLRHIPIVVLRCFRNNGVTGSGLSLGVIPIFLKSIAAFLKNSTSSAGFVIQERNGGNWFSRG